MASQSPKLSPVELQDHYDESPFKERGWTCKFSRIDNQWGIKIYADENARTAAWLMQDEYAKHGLAPMVGDTFEIRDRHGYTMWGYITEIAEPLVPGVHGDDMTEDWQKKLREVGLAYDRRTRDFAEDAKLATGFKFKDLYVANFGILRGELVAIDFGWADDILLWENIES